MIDTGKYEGHYKGSWANQYGDVVKLVYPNESSPSLDADQRLIIDAPLLLAEVRRLRDIVCLLEDSRITNMSIHDRPQLFADVAEVFRQRNEDTHGHLPNFGEE